MNKIYTFIIFIFVFLKVGNAQNVNFSGTIYNLKHNFQCNNDGTLSENPHPRWQFRFGYNNFNYSDVTNNADYGSGSSSTYGPPGRLACGDYTKTITLPSFSNVPANYVRIDMKSWEEDGAFTACCVSDNTTGNGNGDGGFPCFGACVNADDNCFGWKDISGQINFWNYAPCTTHSYYGDFDSGSFLSSHGRGGASSCGGVLSDYDGTNAGDYGIKQLDLYWDFASSPTITLQPDAISLGGATRNICTGNSFSLQFSTNSFNGWTLGRWVKWQESTDNTNWTDVSGPNGTANTATTFTFTPTQPSVTLGSTVVRYYRAIAGSACSNINTQTTTTNVVTVTYYNGSDIFCTAPSCGVVYVDPTPKSGGYPYGGDNTSTTGGPTTPYLTIEKALSANPSYIRIAKGCAAEPNVCNLNNNVVIEGGYVRSGSNLERWEKSSAAADSTTYVFNGQEAPSGVKHIVAFKSDAKSGWTVKDLKIVTSNTPASTYDASNRGMSNYGFLVINGSSNYTISRVDIKIGNAGAGANGTTPSGTGGGSAGGAGGAGSGGTNLSSGSVSVSKGTDGTPATAGVGSPTNVNGGAAISRGGLGCNAGVNGGNDGNNGSIGATGNTGTTGTAGSAYSLTGNYFIPGGQGGTGGPGGGGQGGGGGSGSIGSATRVVCVLTSCSGFTGGAGGKGGDGGSGGTGGYGGGGAFGIWQKNSNTGANLTEVNISSVGNAGSGGSGAVGSGGNAGVDPGSNNSCNSTCVYGNRCSGKGGKGGTGGQGGKGGDGAVGLAAKYVVDGTASNPTAVTINYPNKITVDFFSGRNNITGRACRYSEIDLTTTLSPSWIMPSGLSIVNDQKDPSYGGGGYSSYSTSSSSIKVTTDNSNVFYDLQAASGAANTQKNGLFIVNPVSPSDRTLPVISNAVSEICDGGTVNLSISSGSWDGANIQEREWKVYDSALVTSSPSSPLFSQTTSSVALTGFPAATGAYNAYIVRYRERHNCCGWSRPVFALIRVFPDATTPTLTPNTTDPTLCYGVGASATFTDGTGGANCTITKQYMLNGDNNWLPYTAGTTVGTTANSSIAIRIRKTCPGTGNVTADCGNDFEISHQWQVFKPDASINAFSLYQCLNPTDNLPYAALSANNPSVGTGVWSVQSGAGTIATPTNLSEDITGLAFGSPTVVRWSVTATDGSITCTNNLDQTITPPSNNISSVSLQSTASAPYYSCSTCYVKDNNTYIYYDNAGKIIAKIEDLNSPSSELGSTEVCTGFTYNANSVTPTSANVSTVTTDLGDQQPYLPRYWSIKPATATDVIVTLYYSAAEYNALLAKANGTRYQFSGYQLAVTKYPGGTGNGSFIAPAATGGENVPSNFSAYNSDHQVSFSINSFSTFYLHPQFFPFAPLPVELVSFTGWNQGSVNKLKWITASELNTSKFSVEKKTPDNYWAPIGEVPAAGNSNMQLTYEYTDFAPKIGNNYYRLKVIDNDASFSYSNIINIPIKEAVLNSFNKVYPNPTGGILNVEIQSLDVFDTKLFVYDVIGQKSLEKSISLTKGLNTLNLDCSNLSKGTYILQFLDKSGKLHNAKFIKE